jgi:transposase
LCDWYKIRKKLKYHQINDTLFIERKVYHGKRRPKKGEEAKCIEWQAITQVIEQKSCFILATNTNTNTNTNVKALSPEEVFKHYKAQSVLERGFRFLKYYLSSILYPLFFVSSLFIKNPSRIDALVMVMTLSLFIYSMYQQRMRANMNKEEATIPTKSIKK